MKRQRIKDTARAIFFGYIWWFRLSIFGIPVFFWPTGLETDDGRMVWGYRWGE